MLPILQICSQKSHTQKELEDSIADRFNITEQERRIILRNKETYLTNRIYWATLYLRKASLLVKKEDSFFYATEDGEKILGQNPSKIDKKFLLKIPVFARWINKSAKKDKSVVGNKLDELIAKSLDLIKHDIVYVNDLTRILGITDDVKDLLVHKLLEMQKVTKEDIQYQGDILDSILKYNPPVENNSDSTENDAESIDDGLSYFNKSRAEMTQKIFHSLAEDKSDLRHKKFKKWSKINGITVTEIETEFDMSIEKFISLAYASPPNKISLIREFEHIKSEIGRIPTKQDIDEHSEFNSLQYDEEFQSWEHMLERLGYDPWYRKKTIKPVIDDLEPTSTTYKESQRNLKEIKDEICKRLKNDPQMLELFNTVDKKIQELDNDTLEKIIQNMD